MEWGLNVKTNTDFVKLGTETKRQTKTYTGYAFFADDLAYVIFFGFCRFYPRRCEVKYISEVSIVSGDADRGTYFTDGESQGQGERVAPPKVLRMRRVETDRACRW